MSEIILTQYNGKILGPIAKVLGWIMNGIYYVLNSLFGIENIGLCIIILTLIIYACLFPLTYKQQKFSKLSQKMNPELQAIQKKYKNKRDQVSMQKMQEEIAQLEVTGESGAGLVKVTINGAHNCRRVEIDPSLLEDDKEMLEDLVAAAFNDAARRIDETQKEKMASVSSGMQLPPGFKMPF